MAGQYGQGDAGIDPALHGVRVLDLSRGHAGAYTAQILGDLGADVVRIATADDDGADPAYRAVNRNKRSVSLDLTAPEGLAQLLRLVRDCDVLIEDQVESDDKIPQSVILDSDNPGLIRCAITPYGDNGPRRAQPADDAVIQAQCGLMAITGHADDAPGGGPLQVGAPIIAALSGINGAIGILASLWRRRRHPGLGERVDVAMFDVGVAIQSHVIQNYLITDAQPGRRGNAGNGGHPAQTFPCADGVIYISAGTDQHYARLCHALGLPAMATDPRFTSLRLRDINRAEIDAVLGPVLLTRTRAELMDLLVSTGVPCSPVNSYADLVADPHVADRGLIVAATGGAPGERLVASPLRLPLSPAIYAAPPNPGRDTPVLGGVKWRNPRLADATGGVATNRARPGLPLEGVRILDLGRVLAAPWSTQMLADLGADVLKVERPGRGDDARLYGPDALIDAQGVRTRESAFHLAANRNKRSITVDMSTAEGQTVIRGLAETCDLVLENFIAGSLTKFGLGADDLRHSRPDLIYCSLTGYGQSGPYSDRPGYDAVFQAQGGLMAVTGRAADEPGAGPMKTGPSMMDVSTGHFAALAMLAALYQREITGLGQHLDVALIDVAVAVQTTRVQAFLDSGCLPVRAGNATAAAPTNLYPCRDGELFVSAGLDRDFARLCAALGWDLDDLPEFATTTSRNARRSNLDARLKAAFEPMSIDAALALLAAASVPHAPVNCFSALETDPQTAARGLFTEVLHPAGATGKVRLIANPIRLTTSPDTPSRRPPMLGEHDASPVWLTG